MHIPDLISLKIDFLFFVCPLAHWSEFRTFMCCPRLGERKKLSVREHEKNTVEKQSKAITLHLNQLARALIEQSRQ